jgi:glycosyltransferase involved in cell wall biosynthesis
MKIAFLLTQSLDSPSGLGRYTPLARQLAHQGHQVTVLALHPDFAGLAQKTQDVDGIRIVYVSQMHVRKRGSTKSYFSTPSLILHSTLAAWRLTLEAVKVRADLIYVCKPHPMNGIAGWIAHKLHVSQLWLDCDDYEAASGRFDRPYQQKVIAWFEKNLPRLAGRVTTNTRFMQDKLVSWGVSPQKITYLPNGIDPARFVAPSPHELEAMRSDLCLDDCQVVLYLGSLSFPSHPLPLLIEAFQRVVSQRPQARLVIVGGGEDYAALQKMVEERDLLPFVRLCGRVPADQVTCYYHLADVSVEPVYDDDAARGRCPLKLFESWVCGVPFVSADVGDRRELLGDPPAGLLARPGDPVSLADQILMLLTSTDFADEIRNRAMTRVKTYYWYRLATTLNQAYPRK